MTAERIGVRIHVREHSARITRVKTSRAILTLVVFAALLASLPANAQQSPGFPGRPGPGVLGGGGFGRGGQGFQRGGLDALGGQLRENLRGGQGGQQGEGGMGGAGGLQSVGDANAPVTSVSSGGGEGVRIVGGGKVFAPIKLRDIEYPPIEATGEFQMVSLTGPINVVQFLETIGLATGWNMKVTAGVQQLQTQLPFFQINDMSPVKAMELLQDVDVYYEFDPEHNFLTVMTVDEYLEENYGEMEETQFSVDHTSLEDVETVLTAFKSEQGQLLIDPRTSTVYVRDTRDNIEYMRKSIVNLDVSLEPRVFELVHINADAVLEVLETMLSERGEMRVDPRSNQITVIDHPAYQARIAEFIATTDRKLATRSWTLNYAYPDVVAEQIGLMLPEEMGLITFDDEIHQITVAAVPSRLDDIDELIKMWDKPRKQVQIEAYLLTASSNVSRDLGINWAYFTEIGGDLVGFQVGNATPQFTTPPGSGQNVSIGQLPWTRDLLNPITGEPLEDIQGNPLFREFRGSDVSVVVDYLETKGDVTVLAHPRIVVQDGQEALFENTTQVPFAQSTADQPQSTPSPDGGFTTSFRSISRIDFIDVGTILRVLPRISEAGDILLEISAEDSSFITVVVTGGGELNTVPQKTQNRAETQVMVNNRDTVVIGGLRTTNFADNEDKLPLLGDIPLLGRLFRSTEKNHQDSELLIFITPTIVDTLTSPETAQLAKTEAELAETLRYDRKTDFQRLNQTITGDVDEINVAIGQNGPIMVNQRFVDMEGLRQVFYQVAEPLTCKVILRTHPRAPRSVETEIIDLAQEAGLTIVPDGRTAPFVPEIPPRAIEEPENHGLVDTEEHKRD